MAAADDIGSSTLLPAAFTAVALGGGSTFTIVSGGADLQLGKFNLNVRGGNNLNLSGLSLTSGGASLAEQNRNLSV
jgi:hypothetical protein